MALRFDRPGLWVSGAAHAGILLAALVSFTGEKLPDADEGIPVEVITDNQLSEMTKGQVQASKVQPDPKPRADRVADTRQERDPGEAKQDAPAPPKRPAEMKVAEEETQAPPPPPLRTAEVKPDANVPPPPSRSDLAKAEAAKAAQAEAKAAAQAEKAAEAKAAEAKAAEAKEAALEKAEKLAEQKEAEAIERAKVERAKADAAKAEAAKAAKAQADAKTKLAAMAKAKADDAREKAEAEAEAKAALDARMKAVADARAKAQADAKAAAEARAEAERRQEIADAKAKAVADSKAKADAEAKARKQAELASKFSAGDIRQLLASKAPSQSSGATGREVQRTASLGTATGASQRLNPSQRDQLVGLISEQLHRCWQVPIAAQSADKPPIPTVRVKLNQDGTLAGDPVVTNTSPDPLFRTVADSATRATRRCAPLRIPAQFMPFYADWHDLVVNFDPRDV